MWPDNLTAVNVFVRMSTQWRVGGMGGVIGLVYEALPVVAQGEFMSDEWPDTFESIRILEEATLEIMRSKRG